MEKSFSATAVRRRSEKVRTRQLSGQGVCEPALAAAQLKEQAADAICADDNSVRLSAQLIAGELRLYQTLQPCAQPRRNRLLKPRQRLLL